MKQIIALLVLMFAAALPARADLVGPPDTFGVGPLGNSATDSVLYEGTSLVTGSTLSIIGFDVPAAGTVTVALTEMSWPDRLAELSFAATTATTTLGQLAQAGTTSIAVSGPMALFAIVHSVAQGALNAGLYSLRITFTPAGITPVPLPPALGLLILAASMLLLAARQKDGTRSISFVAATT
ncbi:MAG: hypothetical protein R3E77_15135 [Steroidobacteraceae bacterium]